MERLKDYFDLTRNEQRGILSILILVLTLLLVRISLPVLLPNEPNVLIAQNVERIQKQLEQNQNSQHSLPVGDKKPTNGDGSLHSFDPNQVDEAELKELGFKEWQIKNIINFRKSGGIFHKKEDLKKLYTIKDHDYRRISPFVVVSPLQQSKVPELGNYPKASVVKSQLVELNSADTLVLKSLKGVGSYFAKKIVDRRERLGGFVNLRQLLEIYNLDPEILVSNQDRLSVDNSLVRKININKASVEQLKAHPYVGYKIANTIVKYREQHGKYAAIKEISNSVLISDSVYSKIAPYFTVDDQR